MGSSSSEKGAVLKLPFGYRFKPTNTEIMVYLERKIRGQELPADIIPTVDVYGSNPDQLPFSEFKYGKGNKWYFFTTKPQRDLATEDGYWHSTSDVNVFDGYKVVGFMQILVFYRGKQLPGTKTGWIIHEYRINPDIFAATELNDDIKVKISSLVLCKVCCDKGSPWKTRGTECLEFSKLFSEIGAHLIKGEDENLSTETDREEEDEADESRKFMDPTGFLKNAR